MTVVAEVVRVADGTRYRLESDRTTIGRSPSDAIHLPIAVISRGHAAIERTAHAYRLVDLGSQNGTFVNGTPIAETGHPLRDGDEIVLSGAETLRFVDPMATPSVAGIGRLRGVWIDPVAGAVWVDAQLMEPPLSERQQRLLQLLDHHAGEFVRRETIVEVVWADVAAEGVSPDAIDSLVKRLKKRLHPLQIDELLEVRRGRGIRLIRPPVGRTLHSAE